MVEYMQIRSGQPLTSLRVVPTWSADGRVHANQVMSTSDVVVCGSGLECRTDGRVHAVKPVPSKCWERIGRGEVVEYSQQARTNVAVVPTL